MLDIDMEVEIKDAQVACLSGIIDLQKTCQQEKLRFSPETNQYLLYQTLRKLGPYVAQKLVSKLVERGEITWEEDEDWEVEQILDHTVDEGTDYYLIKWKNWSHAHNSWEPKDNLECADLLEEFHSEGRRIMAKRKLIDLDNVGYDSKRTRVDEIFRKLEPIRKTLSPLQLLSLSSPKKGGKLPLFKGLITSNGQKLPKLHTPGFRQLNPRTKFYKQKKDEVRKALKEWETKLNKINNDPSPIFVENEVDLEGPPENFEYINDYKPGEGIDIPDDPIIGCECEDCVECKKKCCPSAFGSEFAYYKYKRLRIARGTPIYECNKRCKCGPECPNRVVQQGRKFKLCVFRTSNGRGWGVKTLQKIKKGSFVVEYVGEVITNEEAERRGRYYDAVGRTYLFDLDYNDGDCPFTVDAGYYGNVSHFINHCCDPNLEVFGVWINALDPRLPRIALFSRRDIARGEELTFDYMMTGDTTNQAPTLEDVEKSIAAGLMGPIMLTDPSKDDSLTCEKDTNEADSGNVLEAVAMDTPPETPISGQGDTDDDTMVEDSSKKIDSPRKSPRKLPSETKSPLKMKMSPHTISSPSKLSQTADLPSTSLQIGGDTQSEAILPEKNPSTIQHLNNVLGAEGDAEPSAKLLPKSITDQYRIVCQCGAKNCRKYLF
ncbi:histone-lysine N-methyltransferase SUV39H2-like [Pecten maximus]|uniref:histone-lysine N-methyltransferase SUV39H2-like n=1 Tax=Pecten maximus TaxID=6579 RepID=UPI001458A12B|nr:histone-lysine N-methyltransferase SUV39H2-like [Pecten maximus]